MDEIIILPSLICKPPPLHEMSEEYRAELKQWMGELFPDETETDSSDKENHLKYPGPQLPCKRKNPLSLSLNKGKKKAALSTASNRPFATPCSEQELEKLAGGVKPAHTKASTQWAVKNFTKWAENRGVLVPYDPVPCNLLECHDAATVNKYLCMFIAETRKENGDKYPPATIRALLSGINRALQENQVPFSIFDKQNPHFRDLCNTLDVISSALHREGIGAKKKHAAIIEADHEQSFWDKSLLGYSSPRILQRTVFLCRYAFCT